MKTCIKCNNEFPNDFFYKNKKSKDGRLNTCKHCSRKYNLEYKEKHKELMYKQSRDWKLRNKERVKEYMKEYRLKNRDAIYETNRKWIERNKDRYRAIKNACNAQRRANKKCAFVKWADKKAIKQMYKEAKNLSLLTGIQHHVDHIVPLVSEKVCGLHWERNLRIVPYYENLSKGNKLIEDIV